MNTLLLYLLLATPLVFSGLAFLCGFKPKEIGEIAKFDNIVKLVNGINIVGVSLLLLLAFLITVRVVSNGEMLTHGLWLHVDALGALFIMILGVIAVVTGVYSVGYMNHEVADGEISQKTLCHYYGFFHLFLFTMLLAITTNNLIVMWAAIEATTLTSTFLVGIYGQKSSLEAAWKYIIICTVGVAFGLYGTVLVYANAANVMADPSMAVFWTEVVKYPELLDPTLMHIAFIFILLGFGTKMGLFPMHAWLPDAHSEAPSPTSALLSAVLLNCALLVIIRYYIIITEVIGDQFPRNLLLIFGFLSVIVAAFLIIVQRDMKRLLAYSSVENMGLIAIALGIGGPVGIFAALLHTLNHSLAKALLFCGSGNVLLKYGTRDIFTVKGLLKTAPLTAVLLAGGALALGGIPPFNVFISEFMIVTASIQGGYVWFTIILLIVLTVVLGGLVRMVAKVCYGDAPEGVEKGELGILTTAPMAVLLLFMLIMGTCIPKSVSTLFTQATEIVLNQKNTVNSASLPAINGGILSLKVQQQEKSQ